MNQSTLKLRRTGKLITLLFTIVCVSGLNGMEPLPEIEDIKQLPLELQEIIAQNKQRMLQEETKLDELIKSIKGISASRGIRYDTLEHFTNLVHILANKFRMYPCDIARKFKTPISIEYVNLCDQLREKLKKQDLEGIKQLLGKGADIEGFAVLPAVMTSTKSPSAEMIKFLLAQGANPFATTRSNKTALTIFIDMHPDFHQHADLVEVYLLLHKAMNEPHQE